MKQKNKLIITNLFVIFLLLNIYTTSFATDITNEQIKQIEETQEKTTLDLYSKSCILIECATNTIAYEKDSETKMYPASTTKILTALITLEKCNLTDEVTITPEMINPIPSGYKIAYLQVGNIVTVEQLLNLLLVPSTNDAGYALAIHISSSIEEFAKLMNDKAVQIGCLNSHFTNPCGIHDENHYTTAYDLALITNTALQNEIIKNICSQTEYTYNNKNYDTTNTLLKENSNTHYEFTTGLKTGFTSPAGSCIIATAQKENMKYLAIVLGAPEPTSNFNYRDNDCITLFEYGFTNYNKITYIDIFNQEKIESFVIESIDIDIIFKILLGILLISLLGLIVIQPKKKN